MDLIRKQVGHTYDQNHFTAFLHKQNNPNYRQKQWVVVKFTVRST